MGSYASLHATPAWSGAPLHPPCCTWWRDTALLAWVPARESNLRQQGSRGCTLQQPCEQRTKKYVVFSVVLRNGALNNLLLLAVLGLAGELLPFPQRRLGMDIWVFHAALTTGCFPLFPLVAQQENTSLCTGLSPGGGCTASPRPGERLCALRRGSLSWDLGHPDVICWSSSHGCTLEMFSIVLSDDTVKANRILMLQTFCVKTDPWSCPQCSKLDSRGIHRD